MGILLSWTNLVEGSVANLAVESEAPGLGLRAVLTPPISEIWCSAAWGTSTINLDIGLGAGAQTDAALTFSRGPPDGGRSDRHR